MDEPKQFDEQYVRQLRDEAAGYRTRAKDLESELGSYKRLEGEIYQLRVENELSKRGINAAPHFVGYNGEGDVAVAVDNFLEKYPQFAPNTDSARPQPREIPTAQAPEKGRANQPTTRWGDKSWDEMKADPKAHDEVAKIYRNLLPFNNQPKD